MPKSFSIISDDCWGGQLYRQLHIPYLTPTVGLFIIPRDYLNYIENLDQIHQEKLTFIQSDKDYPVATLSGVHIHFMHSQDELEAAEKYSDRFKRINRDKVLYKVDFGRTGFTLADMERWNKLRLPNSVAFYPSSIEIPQEGIHNGVQVPDWELNGARMFDLTRKHFNLFRWLRHGVISHGFMYRLWNALLFDPTSPKRVANKALKAMHLKRPVSA